METKEKKLAQVDELVTNLGLTRDEVIDYLTKRSLIKEDKKSQSKIDIRQVKVGMLWYEDNTFSFDRIAGKKIKAVVELVENSVIYGDLTVSELFKIDEQFFCWYDAQRYIKNFSYPCEKDEEIVWYDIEQLMMVYKTYQSVIKTFESLHRRYRILWTWSSTEYNSAYAWTLGFVNGFSGASGKYGSLYVRPVLALKVE